MRPNVNISDYSLRHKKSIINCTSDLVRLLIKLWSRIYNKLIMLTDGNINKFYFFVQFVKCTGIFFSKIILKRQHIQAISSSRLTSNNTN